MRSGLRGLQRSSSCLTDQSTQFDHGRHETFPESPAARCVGDARELLEELVHHQDDGDDSLVCRCSQYDLCGWCGLAAYHIQTGSLPT